jgi:hypothetical protein
MWRWAIAWLSITVTTSLIFSVFVGLILLADLARKESTDAGTQDPDDHRS